VNAARSGTIPRLRLARTQALALAALATTFATGAGAAAPSSRTFRGHTAQGIPIRLGPQRSSSRAFRYRAWLTCSDGSTFLDSYFSDDVRVRHRHFASRSSSSGGAVLTSVAGTLRGRMARGTIRIVERYSEIPDARGDTPLAADGAIVCDSQVVSWRATARR
jgi:hypothetical protein